MHKPKNIAILTVAYVPQSTSGALQMRDLCETLFELGCNLTVFTPSQKNVFEIEYKYDGRLKILRFKCGATRDVKYTTRLLNEFLMPYKMWQQFKKHSASAEKFDGIITYSPSIFFTPLSVKLKTWSRCRDYLILRDVFPQWAADLGLISNKYVFLILQKFFERQLIAADYIGVQSKSALKWFERKKYFDSVRFEVLQNWTKSPSKTFKMKSKLDKVLNGRHCFVYAGNLGVAQGVDNIYNIAQLFSERQDVACLFVGRGSEFIKLKMFCESMSFSNVVFLDEVPAEELTQIYQRCSAGIVLLDHRHETHNVPGKFISYISNGLPVIAFVNPENDLIETVRQNKLGYIFDKFESSEFFNAIDKIIAQPKTDESQRALVDFAIKNFNVCDIAKQILSKFE